MMPSFVVLRRHDVIYLAEFQVGDCCCLRLKSEARACHVLSVVTCDKWYPPGEPQEQPGPIPLATPIPTGCPFLSVTDSAQLVYVPTLHWSWSLPVDPWTRKGSRFVSGSHDRPFAKGGGPGVELYLPYTLLGWQNNRQIPRQLAKCLHV